jgi:hypothetical protein
VIPSREAGLRCVRILPNVGVAAKIQRPVH